MPLWTTSTWRVSLYSEEIKEQIGNNYIHWVDKLIVCYWRIIPEYFCESFWWISYFCLKKYALNFFSNSVFGKLSRNLVFRTSAVFCNSFPLLFSLVRILVYLLGLCLVTRWKRYNARLTPLNAIFTCLVLHQQSAAVMLFITRINSQWSCSS
jgi:hypothetical protein